MSQADPKALNDAVQKGKWTFDVYDLIYFAGLAMLFTGLALTSIALALIVTGAVLAGVSLINSYVRLWMNRRS